MTLVPPQLEHGDLIVRDGPFTVEERDAIPENGYRHELLDGVLLMTPTPRPRHQSVVGELLVRLKAAVPRELQVYVAPFDVRIGERTAIEPDVVVVRRSDVTSKGIVVAPLLAVEVHSPSTKAYDLGPKKELLAAAGCPSYWTIDPRQPELVVWTLRDGAYAETARVAAQESWTASEPFAVTITPVELLDL
ncbi:Uma2 family endonuclease [Nocardioides sp. LHD-245]|uniref:Uma2 family endonuclease n=1 Tax=Nocardioides sp. LHD-245 TaxID=3051387 RepID=UPI0027DFFADA|nr:Uma2 family endonuclease [Nocardioides sp. LHD-245]